MEFCLGFGFHRILDWVLRWCLFEQMQIMEMLILGVLFAPFMQNMMVMTRNVKWGVCSVFEGLKTTLYLHHSVGSISLYRCLLNLAMHSVHFS